MVSSVRLSTRAQKDFAEITDYLKKNWTLNEIRKN
jgi:hypothetical protein